MEVVCQSFAYQMHMDGLFNADPHPGNILVQVFAPPPRVPARLHVHVHVLIYKHTWHQTATAPPLPDT